MSLIGLPHRSLYMLLGHRVNCIHACHCSCHTSRAVHIMACCTICPACKGFVHSLDNHLKDCHPSYTENVDK